MNFITSSHAKKPQLLYKNYIYSHNKTFKSGCWYYMCKKKGCPASVTISEDKNNVLTETIHVCQVYTDQEIKVILARLDLKKKVQDPNNADCSVRQQFLDMKSELVQEGISLDELEMYMTSFNSQARGLYYAKAKKASTSCPVVKEKKMRAQRGLLIVFEGLDRSGKSTQVKLLNDALNSLNSPSEVWRYPKRTTSIGKLINSYLNKEIEMEDHAVHLLFSANRWETVDEMRKALNNGTNVIMDRYAYSGVAYTAAKSGFEINWCKQCDTGLPKPDLVCFMDTKLTSVDSRADFGQERYETSEFQKLVYSNFGKLFNLAKSSDECLILDAKDSIESLHSNILEHVNGLLVESKKPAVNEIKTLW